MYNCAYLVISEYLVTSRWQ